MNMTAPFGMFAWSGVFLATAGLVMFYKCSRYFWKICIWVIVMRSSNLTWGHWLPVTNYFLIIFWVNEIFLLLMCSNSIFASHVECGKLNIPPFLVGWLFDQLLHVQINTRLFKSLYSFLI
jgi:hypothetical protein